MAAERLPSGWSWAPLEMLRANEPNAITDGPFGSNLKTADYVPSGVRVVRLGNIGRGAFIDEDKAFITAAKFTTLLKHEVRAGDLILAALGDPVGRCCEMPEVGTPAIVKADCVRFAPHPELDRRFIMHALNSPQGRARAEERGHGLGRLRINIGDMRTLQIPVAPAGEQRRIVAKLEALLAQSRLAKDALVRIPYLLEQFRQSVLAAAFRGDLTSDWREQHPDIEPASNLLERIGAERRRRWEEAELERMRAKGKVPKDDRWKERYALSLPATDNGPVEIPPTWTWASLDGLTLIKGGLALGKKRPPGEHVTEVPYLRVANVQRGHLDLAEIKTVPATEEEVRELQLQPGDVLFNEGGDRDKLGRGWVWSGEIESCIHQNHVFRARPVSTAVVPKLLSWYGNTFGQKYFLDEGKQTTNLASVSMSKLKGLPVPVIPEAEQQLIAARVEALLERAAALEVTTAEAIGRLGVLDQSALAKAFRGELVHQDPEDEPASVLLERLRAAKTSAAVETPGVHRRGPKMKVG